MPDHNKHSDITLAAKCAPCERKLFYIEKAGIKAVELYTNLEYLHRLNEVKKVCKRFVFSYAVHAPNDGYEPKTLAELAVAVNARNIIFHDIFWQDEWEAIARVFKPLNMALCVENTYSVYEPDKIIRRFGFKRCLDLEHLQMQCAGFYEEEFSRLISEATHIHMTGYRYGTELWHTNIHVSSRHSRYQLDLLKRGGYKGMVVSEAKVSSQTPEEYKKLKRFFDDWKNKAYG